MAELVGSQDYSTEKVELTEPIDSVERELEPIEAQLIEKLRIATELSRDYLASVPGKNYGRVMNQELIGQILSRSIFGSKNEIPELEELVQNQPQLREKLDLIYAPLPGLRPVNFKDHQDFADKFREMVSRHSLPDRPEYEGKEYKDVVYFRDAQEEVKKMLKHGPARIWTAGDMYGLSNAGFRLPENLREDGKERKDLSGSGEQIKRIARAKWGKFRNLAREENQDFDVLAHENKFDLLSDLSKEYSQTNVDKFVVIDDKVANLEEAQSKLVESGIEAENIILIWDRQGNGGLGGEVKGKEASETAELEARYNAIDEVGNIVAKANSILNLDSNDVKVGWIVDHDDVLSSTKEAKKMIEENVLDWFKKEEVY